jgi:hypothetical protein
MNQNSHNFKMDEIVQKLLENKPFDIHSLNQEDHKENKIEFNFLQFIKNVIDLTQLSLKTITIFKGFTNSLKDLFSN